MVIQRRKRLLTLINRFNIFSVVFWVYKFKMKQPRFNFQKMTVKNFMLYKSNQKKSVTYPAISFLGSVTIFKTEQNFTF
jgi:hypothetical protein